MKYPNSNQSGFSLVETLVSITILLIVIVGPMTISTSTARSTNFSSEQVVAFFLAQEGAEIAQKARDDLLLERFDSTQDGWDTFRDSSTYGDCFKPVGCGLELNTDLTGSVKTPVECDISDCTLYYDSTGQRSRYTHDSGVGTPTSYQRIIKMTVEVDNNDIFVESTVFWRTGSQRAVQEVVVETHLFNVYGI